MEKLTKVYSYLRLSYVILIQQTKTGLHKKTESGWHFVTLAMLCHLLHCINFDFTNVICDVTKCHMDSVFLSRPVFVCCMQCYLCQKIKVINIAAAKSTCYLKNIFCFLCMKLSVTLLPVY